MKIALAGPFFPWRGGISHFNHLLAENFIKLGYEILCINFKRLYPPIIYRWGVPVEK